MATALKPEPRKDPNTRTGTESVSAKKIGFVDRMPFIGAAAAGVGFVCGAFFGAWGFVGGLILGAGVALFAPDVARKA